ncbi:hypothetical protein AtubIFM56815_005722, partial [Aspergillus tubingensis]
MACSRLRNGQQPPKCVDASPGTPGPTEEQLDVHYKRSRPCDLARVLGDVMESNYSFYTPWTQTYHGLKNIRIDPATRAEILVAEFFVNTVKNARMEYKVPIVIGWSQMPYLMKFPDRPLKTIFIALGTHTILPHADARKIIQGLVHAMKEGVVDGLI